MLNNEQEMTIVTIKAYLSIGLCAAMVASGANAERMSKSEMVNVHNKWRSHVGVANLVWSDPVATVAQSWANQLKQEGCGMRHSASNQRQGYGENLYWASAVRWSNGRRDVQKVSATKVVDSWGSEKPDYHYRSNKCNAGAVCGHYTQMVWRNTTKVGCGRAVCEDKTQVWVCHYDPAGNYVGVQPY